MIQKSSCLVLVITSTPHTNTIKKQAEQSKPVRMSMWQEKHELNNTNSRFQLIMLYTTQLIRCVCTTYVHLTDIIITSHCHHHLYIEQ